MASWTRLMIPIDNTHLLIKLISNLLYVESAVVNLKAYSIDCSVLFGFKNKQIIVIRLSLVF